MSVFRSCLLVGIGMMVASCVPFHWMDDARPLGRGNSKVDIQLHVQHIRALYEGLNTYVLPYVDLSYSYGMTDRMDLGWMVSSSTFTGPVWKYNLMHSSSGHSISLGGRLMTAMLALRNGDVVVLGHTDVIYSYTWSRMVWTLQPSVLFQTVFESQPETFGFASLGVHLSVPMGKHLLLRGGISPGWVIYPIEGTRDGFFFTAAVGMTYRLD